MTREETVTIIRAIKASYPTFKPDDLSETVNVWHMMLEDQDYRAVTMALKSYIRTNNSGFAPSIGQLMEYINNMTAPEQPTGTQAWGLVIKAIRNSGYNSLEEFAKLPETVQKAVGSPEQLRSMALSENFNESVESSNFMRSYQVILNREKELQKLSPDVLGIVQEINKNSPKQLLEAQNMERVKQKQENNLLETKKADYVPMPEDAKAKLRELLGLEG